MSSAQKTFSRALKGIVELNLVLETKTGLLIRMPIQAQAYRIGGADHYPMVARKRYRFAHGAEREIEVPYIPGSSLKGRMRSLLELSLNVKLYSTDQKIWQHVRSFSAMGANDFYQDVVSRCIIDELFGYAAANYRQLIDEFKDVGKATNVFSQLAITRLLVEDLFPSTRYVERIDAKSIADFVEEKSENRIDRITSAADPRDIVRVKPGVEFEGKLTLLLMDNDKDFVKKYLEALVAGLRLVEETYLGGSGSRGYGRVKFTGIEVRVLKVLTVDGVPKLVATNIVKKYASVDELDKGVKDLSNEIAQAIYS